jgi:hypothetical protein
MMVLFILLAPSLCWPASETLRIPITLDYAFLRSTFIQQAFTKPGEKAIPLDIGDGCTLIELWDPKVGPEKSLLKLTSNIKVQAGFPLMGKCMTLSKWQGQIDVLQRILVDETKGRVGFEPMGFQTFGADRRKTSVDKSVFDLLQNYLTPYLGKLTFDASGATKGIGGLLPLFFSAGDLSVVGSALATLRPGAVQIKPDGLSLDLLMDVAGLAVPGKPAIGAPQPSDAAGAAKDWQDWDAFLVNQIRALSGAPVGDDEKGLLMEELLEARYGFVQSFSEGALSKDLVTRQFTDSWQALGGLMRKYLSASVSRSPSDYLALFGTSDFLAGFAKAGLGVTPTVSRAGLQGLANALAGPGAKPSLDYSYAVDNDLRSLFGLVRLPETNIPGFDGPEIDVPDDAKAGPPGQWFRSFLGHLLPPAHAEGDEPAQSLEALEPWILKKSDVNPYLERVQGALDEISADTMARSKLDIKHRPMYKQLVYATAWQESCWRQFEKKGGKLRPILSYNQTSVGLMQINERVWRGIHPTRSLRWDTRYNIRAGCEILDLYLRRYALRKAEGRGLSEDDLARAVYAMYNGGPGQLKKYVARKASNRYLKVDQLFWEKYRLVKDRSLDKVATCY